MSDAPEVSPTPDEPLALERKGRTWLWVLLGVVGVAVIAVTGTMLMGKSVVYYKTPTEVAALATGQQVRLAGKLVTSSIVAQPNSGKTDFKITDGKTTIAVVYTGSASTALSTAAKPGTQIVAEGSLGLDHVFRSDHLLAKCPSKYTAKTNATN
jgi:cytochrome c-type biogenesis protein CcmE